MTEGEKLYRSKNNERYAALTNDQLLKLCNMRLANEQFDLNNISIKITERKNSCLDYYVIKFKITREQLQDTEIYGIVFNKFYIDEFDFLHECLKANNMIPISNVIFIQNQHIINLECSCRGYESALSQLKNNINKLLI